MPYSGKPTIYNLTLTSADTEYSQSLPEYVTKIMIKARSTTSTIKLAWVSGQSGSTYITIPANQTYWDDYVGASLTAFVQSSTAGEVVEFQVWSGA